MENIGNSRVSRNRITSKYTYLGNSPEFWIVLELCERILTLAYITQFPLLCTQYNSSPFLSYKYLYSVARTSELRLLLFPSPLSHSSSPSSPLFVTCFWIWKFWSPEFPRSLALRNPGSLRDSTGNRAIP